MWDACHPPHFVFLNFPFSNGPLHHPVKARSYTPKGETWPKDLVKRLLVTFYQSQPQAAELLAPTRYAGKPPAWAAARLFSTTASKQETRDGRSIQSSFLFIQKYKCWRSCCSLHFEVSYKLLLCEELEFLSKSLTPFPQTENLGIHYI